MKWPWAKRAIPPAIVTLAIRPPAIVPKPTAPAVEPMNQETPHMFKISSFLAPLVHFFTGAFTKAVPTLIETAKAELTVVENSVSAFITTDLGKLAVDAVAYASALPTATTNDAKFEAAKVQFIADAKTAGHDLSSVGLGIVDWMVQTAYTAAANISANLSTPPTA